MDVKIFVTKQLGDNSYLVVDENEAILVDPQRDFWRFDQLIEEREYKLRYILETHVHNDYISGSLELKDKYRNVELALPKGGDYEFEHKSMENGDILSIGNTDFEVLETPGHTYEHISWIARNDNQPIGAFTGGSLIVGSSGRTDLLGHDHTDTLTELQYQSIEKLKQFPDNMRIYPTHGSGSFCTSSNPSVQRISTLEKEKQTNQAITVDNLNEFITKQLSGLMNYPTYYKHMAPLNRKGPKVYHELPMPEAMSVEEFKLKIENTTVLDIRHGSKFAEYHIPGSLNFQYASDTANYIGWLLPFNSEILIVNDDNTDNIRDITTQLFRIGFEKVTGYLEGGIESWIEAGNPVSSYGSLTINEIDSIDDLDNNILDVRQPLEREQSKIKNSEHLFIGDITNSVERLDKDKYIVICESGQRAATAASYLQKMGKDVLLITNGGVTDLLKST